MGGTTNPEGLADFPIPDDPEIQHLLLLKKGFATKKIPLPSKSRPGGRLEFSLAPLVETTFQTKAGLLAFIPGKGPLGSWAVADATGRIRIGLQAAQKKSELILIDPANWDYSSRPLHQGKPVEGRVTLKGKVLLGRDLLSRGSIELTRRSPRRQRFSKAILQGRFQLSKLPPGLYRGTIRVGGQIHDNDHEFYLPPLQIPGKGVLQRTFKLPDRRLHLIFRNSDGKRAAFRQVILRCPRRPSDPQRMGHRVSLVAYTDSQGKLSLRGLPQEPFEVLVRAKPKKGAKKGEVLKLTYYPKPEWQEVLIP
jgi:hypothetical protein